MKTKKLLLACILMLSWVARSYAQLVNGNFANGLNGWNVFLPPGNRLTPANGLTSLDIVGDGPSGVATAFYANVGSDALLDLQQNVSLSGGVKYAFNANLAMSTLSDNADGGTVSVYLNQSLVASYWFGVTTYEVNKYATISGTYFSASSGSELLSIDFSRGFGDGGVGDTPIDYIGNISLAPVPEPSTIALFALSGLGFMAWKKRCFIARHDLIRSVQGR